MPRFNFRRFLISALPFLITVVLLSGPALMAYAQSSTGTVQPGGSTGTVQPGGSTGTVQPGSGGALQNPLANINSLPALLDAILTALIYLGSIVLVVMLVYVGFLFVVAQGNSEKLQTARSALIWTLIGGLILLGAKAIEAVITSTINQL